MLFHLHQKAEDIDIDFNENENTYKVMSTNQILTGEDTEYEKYNVDKYDKNIFYADDDHPSIKGAEMINDLIMKEIEKIELKSN